MRRNRAALSVGAGAAALVSAVVLAAPARALDTDRLWGTDRFGTAAAISDAAFPDTVQTVYVVGGFGFADALAAGPAASQGGGPVLTVRDAGVPTSISDELHRLQPAHVVIIGGPGAVTDQAAAQLEAIVPDVRRVWGIDRYSTAGAVAADTLSLQGPDAGPPDVIIASGESYADALSGAAAGAADGSLMLLTARDTLPQATQQALTQLHPASITIIGGTGVISAAVEDSLRSYTTGVTQRLFGADRYATAAAVQEHYAAGGAPGVLLASGADFPDALAGGALGVPLLLTRPDCLPAATLDAYQKLGTTYVTALGGTAAVSDAALAGTPCQAAASLPPSASPPSAVPTPIPSAPVNPGDSKNCTDFTSWRQAQNWYDTYAPAYGDVARLDADHDGIACETLPGAPA